jgi:AcrR family transcriptional regulator
MKHGKPLRTKIARSVSRRPRTKPPEVRRQELLDAAERLFVDQGVAATSVDEIVAAAEVAKGTFYLHFQSKEQLLFALQRRFVDGFCGRLQAGMNRRRPEDWSGRLRAWVEAGVSGYLDSVEVHDVVFHQFRPDHRRPMHANPVVDQLAEFLDQGTRAGAWSAQNPRLNAIMLFHALHGAVDDAVAAKSAVNREGLAATLVAIFRRVVGLP